MADYIQTYVQAQSIDDEDGHFIVAEGTDMTERCKFCKVPLLAGVN